MKAEGRARVSESAVCRLPQGNKKNILKHTQKRHMDQKHRKGNEGLSWMDYTFMLVDPKFVH